MNTERIFLAHEHYKLLEKQQESIQDYVSFKCNLEGFLSVTHLNYKDAPLISVFERETVSDSLQLKITKSGLEIVKYGVYSKVDAYIIKNNLVLNNG